MGSLDEKVTRPQIQAWLLELHSGSLPFEDEDYTVRSYTELVDASGVEKQAQLRAAHELVKLGKLDLDDYQIIRQMVDAWYQRDYTAHVGSSECFNPFAIKASPLVYDAEAFEAYSRGELTIEEYTALLGCVGATGVVPEATGKARKAGRPAKEADPLRSKGKFAAGVAQVWYYDPDSGLLNQVAFTSGKDPIAEAFKQAAEIQDIWDAAGLIGAAAWVKMRNGESKGNKNVVIASARGMLANPQDIVRLHKQALGGNIKSHVGEVMCRTSAKHVEAMLEQNRVFDPETCNMRSSERKVNHDLCLDMPSVEPDNDNEIVFSIKFLSGARREVRELPLADVKDKTDKDKVLLTGHRRRAYRLLLECPSYAPDSPITCKYTTYELVPSVDSDGEPEVEIKVHVVHRDHAIRWAEDNEEAEDDILVELSRLYHGIKGDDDSPGGEISKEAYIARRGRRLIELAPPDEHVSYTVMSSGRTNVNYNSDGTMNWQRAKNDGGPGVNWIARERYSAGLTGGSNWGASVELYNK